MVHPPRRGAHRARARLRSGQRAGGAARVLLGGVAGGVVGGAMALSGAFYLHRSIKRGVDRYSGLPVARLHAGAALVRQITNAELVVFGHTHCEDEAEGYKNSAS